jgi:ABC-type glycerol-3-phosphate transport system substrate-binding protein
MQAILAKNYMSFGLPYGMGSYAIFLYQGGGEFYINGGKATGLDQENAIAAFRRYTEFYTMYVLPRDYAFVQRFRQGEIPIGIEGYTTYNSLQVAAPEIKGLWGFTNIPGTLMPDGTIDRTNNSGSTAVIMMSRAPNNKENAWRFMDWWTSDTINIRYGRALEALMGAAARYNTANINALRALPWPTQDFRVLSAQFATVKGIPEVPGGYFTSRHITNASARVVIDRRMEPREALMEHAKYINEEIRTKRREFGLDLGVRR